MFTISPRHLDPNADYPHKQRPTLTPPVKNRRIPRTFMLGNYIKQNFNIDTKDPLIQRFLNYLNSFDIRSYGESLESLYTFVHKQCLKFEHTAMNLQLIKKKLPIHSQSSYQIKNKIIAIILNGKRLENVHPSTLHTKALKTFRQKVENDMQLSGFNLPLNSPNQDVGDASASAGAYDSDSDSDSDVNVSTQQLQQQIDTQNLTLRILIEKLGASKSPTPPLTPERSSPPNRLTPTSSPEKYPDQRTHDALTIESASSYDVQLQDLIQYWKQTLQKNPKLFLNNYTKEDIQTRLERFFNSFLNSSFKSKACYGNLIHIKIDSSPVDHLYHQTKETQLKIIKAFYAQLKGELMYILFRDPIHCSDNLSNQKSDTITLTITVPYACTHIQSITLKLRTMETISVFNSGEDIWNQAAINRLSQHYSAWLRRSNCWAV